MTLSPQQQQELDEFYWETDISTVELQQHFGLAKGVHLFVSPLPTGVECPNCGSILVYRSRASRTSDEKICVRCGHNSRSIYSCHCAHCTSIREEEERKRKQEAYRRAVEVFNETLEETATLEYVGWALSTLSRREKIFLKAFIEVVEESESPSFEEICDRAKVVSHRSYTDKLLQVKLLYHHPDGSIMANPAVSPEMIEVKNVRSISKSLRFEVFQRDNHTCQYCGRKAPEVELEIDHLIPVAKGGTDDFDNLITSCEDCNGGKSAKLIESFTGGYSKEEWRERLRAKRAQALKERRRQLDDVFEHWARCRGTKRVSDYDAAFILRLIERYEPEWIKAAIQIAAKRRPSNYAKYTAGILRNWAENGLPEHLRNPDAFLDKRKATPRQISYIQGLLNSLGLELAEVYIKSDFDILTMLDARNLIEALTSFPEEEEAPVEEGLEGEDQIGQ